MKLPIHLTIRRRLLLAYLGVLVVGFLALTLLAGQQISTAARADFEQRMENSVQLLAQTLRELSGGTEPLNNVISNYEQQLGADITLLTPEPPSRGGGFSNRTATPPEVETALRGETVTVERVDANGNPALFTAAQVTSLGEERRSALIIQLSVPLSNLQSIIWQRWLSLALLFGFILLLALSVSLAVARSIIRPLEALRESAVRLSTGDFTHRVLFSGKDEIGEVAQAFNLMAGEVQSMLEEQRAFASNTSHELRTPLTTIRLRSEALRYDTSLDPETNKLYIAEIDDEANRMSTLIEDLTVLSRFDAGRTGLGNDEIDPIHLVASIYSRFKPECQAKQIKLSLTTPESIPPIHASINHMTVLFRNLLDNAIKYTPEGGCIDWHLTAEADGVRSVIKDTGRGLEPDELAHVFERFYRVDKSRSRDIPGSGLGLAIVKSIIEAYGGRISIDSEGRDNGTTVTLYLPYQTLKMKSGST
jgi:signal transduction histidine kinase